MTTLLQPTEARVFRCTLPMPPTANNLFPTSKSGHRFPSKAYKAWKNAAEMFWSAWIDIENHGQTVHCMVGRIEANYKFYFADKRKRDVCNFEKATTDFLVERGVIFDDCHIDKITLERGHVLASEARVEVELREI